MPKIASYVGALPKPAGVGLEVLRVTNINQIFGLAKYGETDLSGIFVGLGTYSAPQSGSIARYA